MTLQNNIGFNSKGSEDMATEATKHRCTTPPSFEAPSPHHRTPTHIRENEATRLQGTSYRWGYESGLNWEKVEWTLEEVANTGHRIQDASGRSALTGHVLLLGPWHTTQVLRPSFWYQKLVPVTLFVCHAFWYTRFFLYQKLGRSRTPLSEILNTPLPLLLAAEICIHMIHRTRSLSSAYKCV